MGRHAAEHQPGAVAVRDGTGRDVLGLLLRGTGQILVTLGVVVLLFAVYEVWVTNIFAEQKQAKVHRVLEQQWKQGTDLLSLPPEQLQTHAGDGIANLYIPRLGPDYSYSIVEGSTVPTDAELTKGPAHYARTQLPGEAGNFALAGHRVGKGEPFLNLDKLKPGDPVIVETASTWFVYCVLGVPDATPCDPTVAGGSLRAADPNGVTGQEVVQPTKSSVVWPVPDVEGPTDPLTTSYLTMTTCTPKFSATQRLIVHAVLDPAYPQGIAKQRSSSGYSAATPPEIAKLYTLVEGKNAPKRTAA
ncbi:MAG TPA: class E sortase [Jatrophihabitans sp.]|jgi:sortase A